MSFKHYLCAYVQAKVARICDNLRVSIQCSRRIPNQKLSLTTLAEEGENLEVKRQILLKQIGAKIAYYRTLRDMSQTELAKRVYLSRSALSKIERGKYNDNVSVITLSDIAEALQIDLTLLVTFNDMERQMWWNSLPSEFDDDDDDDENPPAVISHRKQI